MTDCSEYLSIYIQTLLFVFLQSIWEKILLGNERRQEAEYSKAWVNIILTTTMIIYYKLFTKHIYYCSSPFVHKKGGKIIK